MAHPAVRADLDQALDVERDLSPEVALDLVAPVDELAEPVDLLLGEITDLNGAVVSWGSAGVAGFKGSRKSTPYAAALSAEVAARKAMEHGMRQVEVFVKGPGAGREQAIRSLQSAGLEVSAITDVTPIPHNGCRPPKRRRV